MKIDSRGTSAGIKDKNMRPYSASLKNTEIFKFKKQHSKIEFPKIGGQKSTLDRRFPNSIEEKEKVYEENINLKTFINLLKSENNTLRSEINKLKVELNNCSWRELERKKL